MSSNVIADIIEFVSSRSAVGSEVIAADDRLLEDGIIDSLGLLDLVSFVEKQLRNFC